jgi:hypothetical protein
VGLLKSKVDVASKCPACYGLLSTYSSEAGCKTTHIKVDKLKNITGNIYRFKEAVFVTTRKKSKICKAAYD